jgi:hypothetical protein
VNIAIFAAGALALALHLAAGAPERATATGARVTPQVIRSNPPSERGS